ncbi:MAG: hypothetical protein STHCBS139747_002699 [Sporothrix thermara]
MASLPEGWESDYDGNRWFFRYKATGAVQYIFPKEGDEFPEYFDNFGPISQSYTPTPEERLESDRQRRKLGMPKRTPSSSTTARNRDDEPMSATVGRGDFLDASSYDMFGGFLGPASFTDVSPVDEHDDGPTSTAAALDDPTQRGIVEADSNPASHLTTPSIANSASPAGVPASAADVVGEVPPFIQPVEVHELPDAATKSGRHYASDPVGNMSELATEQTLHCEDELAPVELDSAPIQPGPAELAHEPVMALTTAAAITTPSSSYALASTATQAAPPPPVATTYTPTSQSQTVEVASGPSFAPPPPPPPPDESRQPPIIADLAAATAAAAVANPDDRPSLPHEEHRRATLGIAPNSTVPLALQPSQPLAPLQSTLLTHQTPPSSAPLASLVVHTDPPTSGPQNLNRVPSILQPGSNRAAQVQTQAAQETKSGPVLSDVPLVLRPATDGNTSPTVHSGPLPVNIEEVKDISVLEPGEIAELTAGEATNAFVEDEPTLLPSLEPELMPAPLRLSRQGSPVAPSSPKSLSMPSIPNTPLSTAAVPDITAFGVMIADDAIPAPLKTQLSPSPTPSLQASPPVFGILSPSESETLSQQLSIAVEAPEVTPAATPASPPAFGVLVDKSRPAPTPPPAAAQLPPSPILLPMSANFASAVAAPAPQSPADTTPPLVTGQTRVPSMSATSGLASIDESCGLILADEQPQQPQPLSPAAVMTTPSSTSPPPNVASMSPPVQQQQQQQQIHIQRKPTVQRKAVSGGGAAAATAAAGGSGPATPQFAAAQSPQFTTAPGVPAPSTSPAPSMMPATTTLPHRPSVSSVSSQSAQTSVGAGDAVPSEQRAPTPAQSVHSVHSVHSINSVNSINSAPNQGTHSPLQMHQSPAPYVNPMHRYSVSGAPIPTPSPTSASAQSAPHRMSMYAVPGQALPPGVLPQQVFPGTLPQPGTVSAGAVSGATPQHRMSLPGQLPSQQSQKPFFSPPPLVMGGVPPPLPSRLMTPQQQPGQMGQVSPPLAAPGVTPAPGASPAPNTPSTSSPGMSPHPHHAQTMPLAGQPMPGQPVPGQPIPGQPIPGQPNQSAPGQQPMVMGPNGVLIPLSQAYPHLAMPPQMTQQAQVPQQPQAPHQAPPQPYIPTAHIPGTTTTPAPDSAYRPFASSPAPNSTLPPAGTYRPFATANKPAMTVGTAPPKPGGNHGVVSPTSASSNGSGSSGSSGSSTSGLFSKIMKNPAVQRTAFTLGGILVGDSIGMSSATGAQIGASAYSTHQQYKRQSSQQAAMQQAVQKAQADAAEAQRQAQIQIQQAQQQAQQQILAAQQQALAGLAGGRPPLHTMHTAPGQMQHGMPTTQVAPQPYIPGQTPSPSPSPAAAAAAAAAPAPGAFVPGQRPSVPMSFSAPPGQVPNPPGAAPGAAPGAPPGAAPGAAPGMAANQDHMAPGRPHASAAGRGYAPAGAGRGYNPYQYSPGATSMPPVYAAGSGRGYGPMPGGPSGPSGPTASVGAGGANEPSVGEQLANTVINTLLQQYQQQQQQDPFAAILQQQQQQQQQQQNVFLNILSQSQNQPTTFVLPTAAPAPVPVFDTSSDSQVNIDVVNNITIDNSGAGSWGDTTVNYSGDDWGGDLDDFGGNAGGDFGGGGGDF